MSGHNRLPVLPMPAIQRWGAVLADVAACPLALCPQFPQVARRHEAWWRHGVLDRPLFMAEVNPDPDRPVRRRLELLSRPDEWLRAKQQDLMQVVRIGDALPSVRVDFGAVMLGGLVGGRTEFQSDTTWTHAFIDDDWSNAPSFTLDESRPWWRLLLTLTRMVSEDARGRYLLRTPDLGGSCDVLLNLRGSTELCVDALERPERLVQALDALYPTWHRAFTSLYDTATAGGAGIIHWLGLWSERPYVVPACDFNYLIGPEAFQRIALPDIVRQAATAGRAVFHLDGPGAARHVESLLDAPEIDAIQFVPGEGTPSTLPWVGMFRRIQSRGRSLLITTPIGEVAELMRRLRPEGLALQVNGACSVEHACDVFAQYSRYYGAEN